MEKRARTPHGSTHMELSASLANVIFGLYLTMKNFFGADVGFVALAGRDLPASGLPHPSGVISSV